MDLAPLPKVRVPPLPDAAQSPRLRVLGIGDTGQGRQPVNQESQNEQAADQSEDERRRHGDVN